MNDLKIKITELEEIFSKIFARMKEVHGENGEIQIDKDYYWNIRSEELYEPYKDPSDFTMGQLYEDWEMLSKTLAERNPASIDLKKLSSLLRYMGEKEVW